MALLDGSYELSDTGYQGLEEELSNGVSFASGEF